MVGLLRRYSNSGDWQRRLPKSADLAKRQVVTDTPAPRVVTHPAPRVVTHLTDAEELELVALYLGGSTIRELAKSVGISRDRMSAILQTHGVERRYHETVPIDLALAEDLAASGLSLTEVAERMGVGRATLVRARRTAACTTANSGPAKHNLVGK